VFETSASRRAVNTGALPSPARRTKVARRTAQSLGSSHLTVAALVHLVRLPSGLGTLWKGKLRAEWSRL
jgi:hypothetical protein